MEVRCVFCGADVSDMSIQVCRSCLNERMKAMNAKRTRLIRKEREHRRYCEWLSQRPDKWRIISYLKWLSKEPKLIR